MSLDLYNETLRLLRQRSLSQRDLAAQAQVSQKWISLMEQGKAGNPSYTRLVRLRNALLAAKVRRA